jgi:hypothetical protein
LAANLSGYVTIITLFEFKLSSSPNEDVNSDDPSFVMNGTIRVTSQPNSLSSTNLTAAAVNPVTVGTYMVPAMNLDKYISALTSKGFSIDGTHTFNDLRGGQEGTGPEQTMIVWTSSGKELDQVVAALKEITPSLACS